MTTRAVVCSGLNEPWKTEEVEIDPRRNREVRVKMVYAGMCHSDEHLRTGDISAPPEVLEMIGVPSMFPVVGGHEGSGIVTEVGTNVTQVALGDHVAVSFIPSCGTCHWCARAARTSATSGMFTLAGGMISDGTYRYHLGGENLNRMAQLGTFADEMVCHENSLVHIDPPPHEAAALISCGISTGFGSAVDRAKVKPGRDRGRRRVRGRRIRRHPRGAHRRRPYHRRRRPGALQAGEGQGGRRHPQGGLASSTPSSCCPS